MGVCDPLYPPGSELFYRTLASAIICVIGAALAAGLTMGLVSQDEFDLRILLEANPDDCETYEERQELEEQQQYARKIMPLVHNHHRTLVTLLLMNCISNESMPLFLDSLVPSVFAIILSVTFILMFGEIIPSAVFTGKASLRISAKLSPLVYFMTLIMAPVAVPIAMVLDRVLGVHQAQEKFTKAHLMALLRLQVDDAQASPARPWSSYNTSAATIPKYTSSGNRNNTSSSSSSSGRLSSKTVRIFAGAMSMTTNTVRDVMTPVDRVFMLSESTRLDMQTLAHIVYKGHSRIPIYRQDKNDIVGVLLTKKLTAISPEEQRPISSFSLRRANYIHVNTTTGQALREMRNRKAHLLFVTDRVLPPSTDNNSNMVVDEETGEGTSLWGGSEPPPLLGVVSLLDLIEKLVDEKLEDEDSKSSMILNQSPMMYGGGGGAGGGLNDTPRGIVAKTENEIGMVAAGRLRSWASRARQASAARHRELQVESLRTPLLDSAGSFGGGNGGLLLHRSSSLRSVSFQDEVLVHQESPPPSGNSTPSGSGNNNNNNNNGG